MPVSCIIPFYNEAKRLPSVLHALKDVTLEEILLVDDGSTDSHQLVFEDHRVKLMRFETNKGKAAALQAGFWKAKGDIVLFLDADLNGLTSLHVNELLAPVLSQKANVSLGLREYFKFFDVVGGERVLVKSDWLSFFSAELFHKNAIEIGMDRYILLKEYTIASIKLIGVRQTHKTSKIGLLKGMGTDIYYVVDWMWQLGIFSFSCTYLLFWWMIIQKEGKLLTQCKKLYRRMFAKKYSYLLFPESPLKRLVPVAAVE